MDAHSKQTDVYIVIAAFNEADVIGEVVADLLGDYPNVVVVDDGSDDHTADQAGKAGAVVLRHMINRGQGAALQTGLTYALQQGASYIVTFDADGQHDKADLPKLLHPLRSEEADVCLGSRFLEDGSAVPLPRRVVLWLAVLFTRVTSGLRLSDAHNGLRAFSRAAAEHIDLRLDRMAHASEVLDQIRSSGARFQEIPVRIRYTEYSMAKGQHGSAAFRIAWDYLVGRVFR